MDAAKLWSQQGLRPQGTDRGLLEVEGLVQTVERVAVGQPQRPRRAPVGVRAVRARLWRVARARHPRNIIVRVQVAAQQLASDLAANSIDWEVFDRSIWLNGIESKNGKESRGLLYS